MSATNARDRYPTPGRDGARAVVLLVLLAASAAWAQPDYFDARVAPILTRRCLPCHNNQLKDGGVSFLGRDGLLKGGVHGPTIVPGKPDASLLIIALRRAGPVQMPPGAELPAAEIATLTEWIRRGAPWGSQLLPPASELWRFDNLQSIGGHPVHVEGHPRLIDSPAGRAIQFNGIDDALFLDVHPLAGAKTFTWEVLFRPDPGGAREQRFFHLQERGPGGADTETRMLFEIRVIDGQWCLDSFAKTGEAQHTLLNRERLYPLGAWYRVAMVYDGREFRNYIDGVLQGAAPLALSPQGPGHASVGVRINRVNYFKGAIALARFTRGALSPEDFLK